MHKPVKLEIWTFGRFSITADGIPLATEWPDEKIKMFFCSLLSPLDLSYSWDRICRSMWDIPSSSACRRRLDKIILAPLNKFLLKELGFNPLIAGHEGIIIDPQGISLDAHKFYKSVVDRLRLFSMGKNAAALLKFNSANRLYAGEYLPGITGKIVTNARQDIDSLYRSSVINARQLTDDLKNIKQGLNS